MGTMASFAQQQGVIDSLSSLLSQSNLMDSARVDLQNKLCAEYMSSDPQKALELGREGLALARKVEYANGEGILLNTIGQVYWKLSEYDKALESYKASIAIHEKLGNRREVASSLHNIGTIYNQKGVYDKAIEHFIRSLKLKEELAAINNDKKIRQGIASSLDNIGLMYMDQGKYQEAIGYYQQALKAKQQLVKEFPNDNKLINKLANTHTNIGGAHFYQEQYNKAIEEFREAQSLYESIGNKRKLAYCLNNIGGVYYYQNKYDQALQAFYQALVTLEELEDKQGAAGTLLNISELYMQMLGYEQATKYAVQSLKTAQAIGFRHGVKEAYLSLAVIASHQEDYQNAYQYHQRYTDLKDSLLNEKSSKQIAELQTIYETEKKEKEIELLNKDKEIQEAENKRQRMVIIAAIGGILLLAALAFFIFRGLQQKKRANALLNEQNIEITRQKEELAKLSIVAEKTDSGVMIADKDGMVEWVNTGFVRLTGYNFEEFREKFGKTLVEVSSHTGMDQILKFVLRKKRSFSYDSSHIKKDGEERWTSATITPVFTEEGALSKIVTVYSDITAVKQAEAALEEKNEDITDSIRYAERIQAAIMPKDEEFSRLLPDAFLLFKPKDIVSGDFYWMVEKEGKVLFCTADCTGHGVPGAFMSMINSALLNEVVNENGITQPNEIFYEVRKGLVKAMKQKGEIGEQKDGMDASLCSLSRNGKGKQWTQLECAVANNPVLIIRKRKEPVVDNGIKLEPILEQNNLYMYEIKADRQPVGYKTEEMTPYTHHSVNLLKEDLIYTFSDGYQDQFGGPKGKKFMIKRQKELLMDLYDKPLSEQRAILDKTLEEWMAHPDQPDGYSEQIDDILLIAVKV